MTMKLMCSQQSRCDHQSQCKDTTSILRVSNVLPFFFNFFFCRGQHMWSLGHYVIRSLTFSGCQNPHYKINIYIYFIVSKNDQSKSFLTNDIMTKWQCLFLIMVDSFLLFSWCGWQSFSWTSWHFTGIVDTLLESLTLLLKRLTLFEIGFILKWQKRQLSSQTTAIKLIHS